MKNISKQILNRLPYSKPFLFVDTINEVDENHITGSYKFDKDNSFYNGHFTGRPVTPGVLLLEVMGQIGLVSFGIYLMGLHESLKPFYPILSHLESDFLGMVLPGEKVMVHAEKIYFRNNILKCKISMTNSKNEVVLTTMALCTFKIEST